MAVVTGRERMDGMRRPKAPRHIGVMSLWGEPEVTVTIRRKPGTVKKAPKPVTGAGRLAAAIVASYVLARRRVGLPDGDERWKAELGLAAKTVAESESFPEDVMADAAVDFAITETKRRPAFFVEWVRAAFWRLADREHAYWKAQERLPLPPDVAALVGGRLRPVTPKRTVARGRGPRRKLRCPSCFEVYFDGEGIVQHVCDPTRLAAAKLEGRLNG